MRYSQDMEACYSYSVRGWQCPSFITNIPRRLRISGAFCDGGEMTEQEKEFVKACIKKNDMHAFYVWGPWKRVRRQVLEMDHGECQRCKKNKTYTKATTVHHVNYVKKHPDKALDIFYEWHGEKKRNLISLCHECHEAVHGYRKPKESQPLTEERWD